MVAATRRERLRAETITEIKQAAWAELQDAGVQDLSLRGVARRLGMAPSALYRYFESRDELLTALIIEAYSALGDELERRYKRASTKHTAAREVFLEVARAYRKWALSHPLEYRLIFGTSIPGYTGTEQTTEASMRSAGVLLRIMADLVHQEGLSPRPGTGQSGSGGAQAAADLGGHHGRAATAGGAAGGAGLLRQPARRDQPRDVLRTCRARWQ